MRALGRAAREPARVYLTGGATAVLHGWRVTTVDMDMKVIPDRDDVLRMIPRIKEELSINVELAAPSCRLCPVGRNVAIHRQGGSPRVPAL